MTQATAESTNKYTEAHRQELFVSMQVKHAEMRVFREHFLTILDHNTRDRITLKMDDYFFQLEYAVRNFQSIYNKGIPSIIELETILMSASLIFNLVQREL